MRTLYDRALAYATLMHRGQERKYTGEPYVNHCIRVAGRVRAKGGTEEMVAAALLHDTVEDTEATIAGIDAAFGPTVAKLVLELTDEFTKEAYPRLNRAQRKVAEAARLANVSDGAKLIKLCDLADNTSSIVDHDPSFAAVYLPEKAAVLVAMGFGPDEDGD